MKRRIRYRILSIWTVCMAVWCMVGSYVKASEADSDYVVIPVITEQTSEVEPCFALTIEPSRKQAIEVEVRNNTDRDATVYARFYTAVTGADGTVKYIGPDEQADTAGINLSDIITGERELIIPAGKSYLFQFTVNMPAKGLDNPTAGGLIFLITPEQQVESTESSQIVEMGMQKPKGAEFIKLSTDNDALSPTETIREGLTNWLQETSAAAAVSASFSYVVPLFLEAGESVTSPGLTLVDISDADYKNAIKAKIQNATSISATQVTIEATVRRKGKKEVFFEVSEKNINIPAHSDYELVIPSKGKNVKAGEYTLQINLAIGNTEWEWKKNFIISEEEANGIMKSETDIQGADVQFGWGRFIILTVFFLLVTTMTICFILYRKKQKEEEAILKVMKDIRKLI